MDAEKPPAIIEVTRVHKEVDSPAGTLRILDDISFGIATAEAVAIVGVSGSGKSTLLAILAGLDSASSGRVLLDGQDLSTLDEDARARLRAERVGFVFQSFHLLPNMTALENVMLPLELAGRVTDVSAQAVQLLERVGLGERLGHYPNQLSGGEQQRVALARAFAGRPRILFADEPTGNLDKDTAAAVTDQLFALRAEAGSTLILVTHDDRLALRCDRVLEMSGGRLRERAAAPC